MKPISFAFKESAPRSDLDFSQIEYNSSLNLSVNRKTRLPAIDSIDMETETSTKTRDEVSDADNNVMRMLMDTETRTLAATELSDSDRDRTNLQLLMDTATLTESSEATDQDKDWK